MHRTTIFLPEELDASLKRLAVERSQSKARLIREALEAFLRDAREGYQRPEPVGIGAYSSGRSDISSQRREIMLEGASERRNNGRRR